mmetsp:Transcript_17721/g.59786  ORF Transcript_17721/g.59786 Transcript_17721/m.59786 type:complete len:303 (-) Transcript_17721:1301-2209(-)
MPSNCCTPTPPSSRKSSKSPWSDSLSLSRSSLVFSAPRLMMASISSSVGAASSSVRKIADAPNLTASSISSFEGPPAPPLALRRPCCTTMASSLSFFCARSTIFSSMVLAVTKRYTCTGFFCPMRWHRSIACRSACGFQSLSYKTQVSAVCRLMPKPPARVESKNANLSDPTALKQSICSSRSSCGVLPSMRQYLSWRKTRKSSRMSSMLVIWEKIKTRWPFFFSLCSNLSKRTSLAQLSTRCSPSGGSVRSSTEGKRYGWLQHLRSCIAMFEIVPRDADDVAPPSSFEARRLPMSRFRRPR